MNKNKIYCKKCNEEFNSMLDFRTHICPNEYKKENGKPNKTLVSRNKKKN